MKYIKSKPFGGNIEKAFTTAESILLPNSFRLLDKGKYELVFTGPGMFSSQQNALLGATRIRISANSSELHLYAELGGVRFMTYFICIFPFALAGLLAVIFTFKHQQPFMEAARGPMISILPWIVLSPLLRVIFKRRTEKALDTLLSNMTAQA